MTLAVRTPEPLPTLVRPRRVTHTTAGQAHGPITRLVSPSDIGELIKPFVFLDYFEADPADAPAFGFHPHSGIATLTLMLGGQVWYEETTGRKGIVETGGVEWMRAGNGVWHTGGAAGTERIKGYQLWIALPAELESAVTESQYLGAFDFQSHGPAGVVLGRHGNATSNVAAPETINYLEIKLSAGERWRYEPPDKHTVAWIAVYEGNLGHPGLLSAGDFAVFEESGGAIEFEALTDTGFILGSAVKHP